MARAPRPELIALLDAVKDDPADRTPWLVLTDWLEENGDDADRARAEYCRLCLGKMGVGKITAAHWEQGERRRELFREWGTVWLGPLLDCRPEQKDGLFHLVLTQPLHALRPHPEAMAWVSRVQGGVSGPDLEPDMVPLWREVRELTVPGPYDCAALLQILEAPHFARLRRLQMGVNAMTGTQARRLAEVAERHPVRELDLSWWGQRIPEARKERLRARLGGRLRI